MENIKGFCDFCIPYKNDNISLIKILKEAYELGYRTVAIEQIFDHSKKAETKRSSDIFPAPIDFPFLEEFKDKLKILQRLTIIYSDVGVAHFMTNSLNIKKFHLVAGLPKNDAALIHCCASFNGDIISADPDTKLLISRKSYQLAVKRGMYLEIKYASVITNSSHRKEMIRIAHNYHARGKSKNVIFTSGATNEFDLRGPYDIANLALIFGLTEEEAKNTMQNNCKLLFLRAESRRLGKTIMFVKQRGPRVLSSSSEDEDDDDDDDDQEEEEKKDHGTNHSEVGKHNSGREERRNDEINDQHPHKRQKIS